MAEKARKQVTPVFCQVADCANVMNGRCCLKVYCKELGCGRNICHEHQHFQTKETDSYTKEVVAALCTECHPQMLRYKDTCAKILFIVILLAIVLFVVMIFIF